MKALLLETSDRRLRIADLPEPTPGPGAVRVRVRACAVCRTDLHVADGELTRPKLPLVLGHQVTGTIDAVGSGVDGAWVGRRVGVPWLASACGTCAYCVGGRENLCGAARFTGYDVDGGFAERTVADARFVIELPAALDDVAGAPLLCAGAIGWRALRMAGDAPRIGLWGFGASAHLVAQLARSEGRRVMAFVRPGDSAAAELARTLGAEWAGSSDEAPPEEVDAAIVFAPVGALVPRALSCLARGGTVICAGIHMSDIPSFPYELLWGERCVRSVANLTRRDVRELFAAAHPATVRAEVTRYPLQDAATALDDLRLGRVTGAAVVTVP